MKSKLLIASALIALGCGSIFAQNTLQKPADQVRIYINPGHGSWGPNNRPMQTIGRDGYNAADVDTTGFFESNTNLLKGYSLLDRLETRTCLKAIAFSIVSWKPAYLSTAPRTRQATTPPV